MGNPAPLLVVPAADFVQQHEDATPFLVDPYVPMGGIIFLYGKTSIGKSPLSWALADAVAGGKPWLTCPTRRGNVIYLEVDTPARLVRERLKLMPQPIPPSWIMVFARPFNVLYPADPVVTSLRQVSETYHPALVIVNTLRKTHWSDDKESHVPGRVYGAFQTLFPTSALWFNHHDKKTGDPNQARDPDEEFSGTQAWLNDATVGLHLIKSGQGAGMLQLIHTKSQVSAKVPPLTLRLAEDGTTIAPYDRGAEVRAIFGTTDPQLSTRKRAQLVADQMGLGLSTVQRWLSKDHTPDEPQEAEK